MRIKNLKHRDGFTFFKSYDDVLKKLTDKEFVLFTRTLLDVQFLRIKYENVVFEDQKLDLIWSSLRFNIESQIDGYLSNKNKNDSQFMGVYDKANGGYDDPLDGGYDDPLQYIKGKGKGKGNNVDTNVSILDSIPANDLELAKELIAYRKKIKKPLKTEKGIKDLISSIHKIANAGYDLRTVVELMQSKEWQSIKLEWVQKEFNQSKPQYQSKQDKFEKAWEDAQKLKAKFSQQNIIEGEVL